MKRLFKFILWIALFAGLYVSGVLIYGTLTDFQPPEFLEVQITGDVTAVPDSTITFVTWNIGFTGLGAETDFFYDGGKTVIQTEELVAKNRQGIARTLHELNPDVVLLQEVDSIARRSHYNNNIATIGESLPLHSHSFAVNYQVDFVPMPLYNPMGKVISGLVNYSRFHSYDAERHAYHSQFSWPTSVFFLDRCFLSQRIPLADGHDLVIINTHCSAYDTSGSMVAEEIRLLMDFANAEYQEGNYVVIGGDWNQCPPNYTPISSSPSEYNEYILTSDQLPDGFSWVADPSTPTNRKLETIYTDSSYTSVIDHFVVSDNLEVEEVKVIDTNFEFSDHQPVFLRVKL